MNDKNLHKLLAQVKSEVREVLAEDAYRLIKDGGPCLRCMWPTPPHAELAPM